METFAPPDNISSFRLQARMFETAVFSSLTGTGSVMCFIIYVHVIKERNLTTIHGGN